MAHFWKTRSAAGESWQALALAGDGCVVSSGADGLLFDSLAGAGLPHKRGAVIVPAAVVGGRPCWALLPGREATVRINGQPVALGIRALRDRDEISVGAHRCFFSSEELAAVIPFPGLAQPAFCPRCKQKLETGEPSVACPNCHAWHHQSEKFPCWTYDATCALCRQQATALDAGYSWTPDQL